jgi:hypothetical protein
VVVAYSTYCPRVCLAGKINHERKFLVTRPRFEASHLPNSILLFLLQYIMRAYEGRWSSALRKISVQVTIVYQEHVRVWYVQCCCFCGDGNSLLPETQISVYQTARYHNPADRNVNLHCRGNPQIISIIYHGMRGSESYREIVRPHRRGRHELPMNWCLSYSHMHRSRWTLCVVLILLKVVYIVSTLRLISHWPRRLYCVLLP